MRKNKKTKKSLRDLLLQNYKMNKIRLKRILRFRETLQKTA